VLVALDLEEECGKGRASARVGEDGREASLLGEELEMERREQRQILVHQLVEEDGGHLEQSAAGGGRTVGRVAM